MSRHFAIVALTIFLACFVSFNFDVDFDGAKSTYYGLPLPWNARSPAASLIKDVFLVPALIDLVVLAFFASRLLRAGDRLGHAAPRLLNRISLMLGGVGFIVFAVTFTVNDVDVSLWPDTLPTKVIAVRIDLGV